MIEREVLLHQIERAELTIAEMDQAMVEHPDEIGLRLNRESVERHKKKLEERIKALEACHPGASGEPVEEEAGTGIREV